MRGASRRGPRAALPLLLLAWFTSLALAAQEDRPPAVEPAPGAAAASGPAPATSGGRVPVRVIAGRLVVACDVSTSRRRIPVNLFVEYEGPYGLQLHNRAAAGIYAETQDGRRRPITIHFPGFETTVEGRELGDEERLEEFTKYHSVALGENAIVGSIGAEVLGRYAITFDLARGLLHLAPPGAPPDVPLSSPRREEDGSWTLPVSESAGLAWVPVRTEGGRPFALALGCAVYDTRIERDLADQLDAPAGDVGPLVLGDFDLSEYVAFRPEELVLVHPDGAFGTLGVNLLEHFRVEVDRVAGTARFEAVKDPVFPVADLAFFQARADEDPFTLEAFLEEHGSTRLGAEAAELLLTWALEEGAEVQRCRDAVEWIASTVPEDLRTTRMLDLMLELADAGRPEVVLHAGALGVESGRDDRYPNAVHEVHGKLGRIRLDRADETEGDLEAAWRHLLSAAFGLPDDGRVNLDLGRCYEAQGRLRRAFSRYVQAVIVPETGPEALLALERVQPLLEDVEPFSVDVIERMIAGKVRNFGAATTFRPTDDAPAQRTALVEFFTNAHLGNARAGAIGGALGNEGLLGHFEPEHVAFLSWHLPTPVLEPLCNAAAERRAEALGVTSPAAHVIDGVEGGPGAARWRQAEGVYDAVRRRVVPRLADATPYGLDLDARVEGTRVTGELVVSYRDYAQRLVDHDAEVQLVLAEAGVLYPGKSTVVVHRFVGRALLLEDPLQPGAGLRYLPDEEGTLRIPFDVDLAEIQAENEAFLAAQREAGAGTTQLLGTRIDPRQVRLVAFVTDRKEGAVVQALSVDPAGPETAEDDLPREASEVEGSEAPGGTR